MKKNKLFITTEMSPAQREHLENILNAADRHKSMYNPTGYKATMREAFSYYYVHNPSFDYSPEILESKIEASMYALPTIKGRSRGRITLWKVLFLLVVGVGLAYLFMFLYAHREMYDLSIPLMLVALFSVSAFLIFLPLLFSRRKKE